MDTWFVTGAGRGIGAEVAQAALRNGCRVVATARDVESIPRWEDEASLLRLPLDVCNQGQVRAAVDRAVEHFGSIDVLVNNAGYGHMGFFEDCDCEDVRRQFETNVFGLLEVTRLILPVMRTQRRGAIFNISSTAGVRGLAGGSLYCASKFAVEGFSESLSLEVAHFGIRVVTVQPGPFRTDFLDESSARFSSGKIPDYQEAAREAKVLYQGRNHRQAGDPRRLAEALVALAKSDAPPMHFPAGSNALEVVAARNRRAQGEIDAWRDLSVSTNGQFQD